MRADGMDRDAAANLHGWSPFQPWYRIRALPGGEAPDPSGASSSSTSVMEDEKLMVRSITWRIAQPHIEFTGQDSTAGLRRVGGDRRVEVECGQEVVSEKRQAQGLGGGGCAGYRSAGQFSYPSCTRNDAGRSWPPGRSWLPGRSFCPRTCRRHQFLDLPRNGVVLKLATNN